MGLASWGDSFDSLKQPFFLPTALLTDSTNKTHISLHTKLQHSPGPNAFTLRLPVPPVSKCTNGELGYSTTTTPTSVTS